MRLSPSRDLVRPNLRCVAAFGTARTAPSQRPVVTRPHAALPCRHTTPTLPHTAATLAPFSPLCVHGREPVPPRTWTVRTTWTDAGQPHPHAPSRRTRRGELASDSRPHVPRAPAGPRGSHRLSRRREGRHSVQMGRFGRKGAAQHAVYCRWVSVREPDCMRVPSQGPHGEKESSSLLRWQRL